MNQSIWVALVFALVASTCLSVSLLTSASSGLPTASRQLQSSSCPSLKFPLNGDCLPISSSSTCQYSDGENNLCSLCNEGYYAKDQFCRRQFTLNCKKYVRNENSCEECRTGYFWSPSVDTVVDGVLIPKRGEGRCKIQSILNCHTYVPSQNACQVCKDGNQLFNEACRLDNSLDCLDYDEDRNICNLCDNKHYVDLGGCKQLTQEHCDESAGLYNICSVCDFGFYLFQGASCVAQDILNCYGYQANANLCSDCIGGTVLEKGKCVFPAPVDQSQ